MRRRRVLGAGVLLVVAVLASVLVLRPTDTGPVLRTVAVGMLPGQVVVDARTGRAFVQNYQDTSVSMLNASSGQVLRTVPIGDRSAFMVVDVPTNRVFVVSDDTPRITLLDAASGAVAGTIQNPAWDGAVDETTGHVFVTAQVSGGMGNTVSMLDGRSGALLHNAYLKGARPQGVAVDMLTNRVFASNWDDDTASMLEASSGRLLRTVKIGHTPGVVAVDARTARVFITNNGADTVSMLDARSGTVLRTIKVGLHPAKPVVDERTGRVFVVHGRGGTTGISGTFANYPQGGITLLDARTGAVLRSLPVGGSPVDDYVGNAPPTNIAVDVRRNRVFVIDQAALGAAGKPSDGDGSVSVLDAGSGSILRTIAVGRHPISLAVDEATARLFVVNTNSGCVRADTWGWIPGSIRHGLPPISQPPKPKCGLPGSVTVIDTSRL